MARPLMYCWKCSLKYPDTVIVCPQCGAANAPGQSNATPPTVGSPRGHDLEVQWTAGHRQGPHLAGGYSLLILLAIFILVGVVIGLLTGGRL
ncbi:MAG: hypothetical protein ABR598_06580 [Candidatus Dormibacteria bacterium]